MDNSCQLPNEFSLLNHSLLLNYYLRPSPFISNQSLVLNSYTDLGVLPLIKNHKQGLRKKVNNVGITNQSTKVESEILKGSWQSSEREFLFSLKNQMEILSEQLRREIGMKTALVKENLSLKRSIILKDQLISTLSARLDSLQNAHHSNHTIQDQYSQILLENQKVMEIVKNQLDDSKLAEFQKDMVQIRKAQFNFPESITQNAPPNYLVNQSDHSQTNDHSQILNHNSLWELEHNNSLAYRPMRPQKLGRLQLGKDASKLLGLSRLTNSQLGITQGNITKNSFLKEIKEEMEKSKEAEFYEMHSRSKIINPAEVQSFQDDESYIIRDPEISGILASNFNKSILLPDCQIQTENLAFKSPEISQLLSIKSIPKGLEESMTGRQDQFGREIKVGIIVENEINSPHDKVIDKEMKDISRVHNLTALLPPSEQSYINDISDLNNLSGLERLSQTSQNEEELLNLNKIAIPNSQMFYNRNQTMQVILEESQAENETSVCNPNLSKVSTHLEELGAEDQKIEMENKNQSDLKLTPQSTLVDNLIGFFNGSNEEKLEVEFKEKRQGNFQIFKDRDDSIVQNQNNSVASITIKKGVNTQQRKAQRLARSNTYNYEQSNRPSAEAVQRLLHKRRAQKSDLRRMASSSIEEDTLSILEKSRSICARVNQSSLSQLDLNREKTEDIQSKSIIELTPSRKRYSTLNKRVSKLICGSKEDVYSKNENLSLWKEKLNQLIEERKKWLQMRRELRERLREVELENDELKLRVKQLTKCTLTDEDKLLFGFKLMQKNFQEVSQIDASHLPELSPFGQNRNSAEKSTFVSPFKFDPQVINDCSKLGITAALDQDILGKYSGLVTLAGFDNILRENSQIENLEAANLLHNQQEGGVDYYEEEINGTQNKNGKERGVRLSEIKRNLAESIQELETHNNMAQQRLMNQTSFILSNFHRHDQTLNLSKELGIQMGDLSAIYLNQLGPNITQIMGAPHSYINDQSCLQAVQDLAKGIEKYGSRKKTEQDDSCIEIPEGEVSRLISTEKKKTTVYKMPQRSTLNDLKITQAQMQKLASQKADFVDNLDEDQKNLTPRVVRLAQNTPVILKNIQQPFNDLDRVNRIISLPSNLLKGEQIENSLQFAQRGTANFKDLAVITGSDGLKDEEVIASKQSFIKDFKTDCESPLRGGSASVKVQDFGINRESIHQVNPHHDILASIKIDNFQRYQEIQNPSPYSENNQKEGEQRHELINRMTFDPNDLRESRNREGEEGLDKQMKDGVKRESNYSNTFPKKDNSKDLSLDFNMITNKPRDSDSPKVDIKEISQLMEQQSDLNDISKILKAKDASYLVLNQSQLSMLQQTQYMNASFLQIRPSHLQESQILNQSIDPIQSEIKQSANTPFFSDLKSKNSGISRIQMPTFSVEDTDQNSINLQTEANFRFTLGEGEQRIKSSEQVLSPAKFQKEINQNGEEKQIKEVQAQQRLLQEQLLKQQILQQQLIRNQGIISQQQQSQFFYEQSLLNNTPLFGVPQILNSGFGGTMLGTTAAFGTQDSLANSLMMHQQQLFRQQQILRQKTLLGQFRDTYGQEQLDKNQIRNLFLKMVGRPSGQQRGSDGTDQSSESKNQQRRSTQRVSEEEKHVQSGRLIIPDSQSFKEDIVKDGSVRIRSTVDQVSLGLQKGTAKNFFGSLAQRKSMNNQRQGSN